jgi:hypothetical protein
VVRRRAQVQVACALRELKIDIKMAGAQRAGHFCVYAGSTTFGLWIVRRN